jgi:hypothetical protein
VTGLIVAVMLAALFVAVVAAVLSSGQSQIDRAQAQFDHDTAEADWADQ